MDGPGELVLRGTSVMCARAGLDVESRLRGAGGGWSGARLGSGLGELGCGRVGGLGWESLDG